MGAEKGAGAGGGMKVGGPNGQMIGWLLVWLEYEMMTGISPAPPIHPDVQIDGPHRGGGGRGGVNIKIRRGAWLNKTEKGKRDYIAYRYKCIKA
jgi:hypothetical protein